MKRKVRIVDEHGNVIKEGSVNVRDKSILRAQQANKATVIRSKKFKNRVPRKRKYGDKYDKSQSGKYS